MDFTVSPPIGTIVWFYEGANRLYQPAPGLVLESNEAGVLRLQVTYPSGLYSIKSAVYHIGNPSLFDGGRPSPSAERNGAWEYHPWFGPPAECLEGHEEERVQKEAESAKPRTMTDKEKEERVAGLSRVHTLTQVAHKVRPLGMSKADVEAIYTRRNLHPPQVD